MTGAGARIATVALVVRSYDEALRFYTEALGFDCLEDTDLGGGKRWVVVAPGGGREGARLLLAEASGREQELAVGNQAGGRVFLFLETPDFDRDYAAFRSRGVHFLEEPRVEPYAKVAVFEDLYGNRWDLLQPTA